MISDQDRHWLSHHLQSLITRIQADAFLMERKLSISQDASQESVRHKASLKELSDLIRAYFDAETIRYQAVDDEKKTQWIKEIEAKAEERRKSREPLATEVADFLEKLIVGITQP